MWCCPSKKLRVVASLSKCFTVHSTSRCVFLSLGITTTNKARQQTQVFISLQCRTKEGPQHNLPKQIKWNDDSGGSNGELPFRDGERNGTENPAANPRENDLHYEDEGYHENEARVLEQAIEQIDARGTHIEGVEVGKKDEKTEKCGEVNVSVWNAITGEESRHCSGCEEDVA